MCRFGTCAATLLPVSEAITRRAIELMEAITWSHGLRMGDALIAATALDHGLSVLTPNVKHFGWSRGSRSRRSSPDGRELGGSNKNLCPKAINRDIDGALLVDRSPITIGTRLIELSSQEPPMPPNLILKT